MLVIGFLVNHHYVRVRSLWCVKDVYVGECKKIVVTGRCGEWFVSKLGSAAEPKGLDEYMARHLIPHLW